MGDQFRLDGKVAVIIGGGGAIGGAIAAGMAEQGAKVVIASCGMQKLQDAAKKIEAETGVRVACLQGDANNERVSLSWPGESSRPSAPSIYWSMLTGRPQRNRPTSSPRMSGILCLLSTLKASCSVAGSLAKS